MDFGFDYYAPQSLSINERTLSIAWLHDWGNDLTPDGAKWCGQMTYPRELELKKNIIYQMPAKELEKQMLKAAAELNFEEAASLRDRMTQIRKMIFEEEK